MVRDPAKTKFVYRDSLWHGADMFGTGVASFGHVNGVHVQNVDRWEEYVERLQKGELPLGRALKVEPDQLLRREMMLFGIDVIIIAPGAVKTPIWSKADEVDISTYKNSPFFPALGKIRKFMMQLGENGLPAETIAKAIGEALTSANPKVRYQLTPDPMRHLATAVLPKRMVDRIIAKRLGLMPPAA